LREICPRKKGPQKVAVYIRHSTNPVKITDGEVKTLKDAHYDEIRYEKVFEWCLPRFGEDNESLFEFQAARMRNYMRKRVVEDGWTSKYYIGNRIITADHVTRFYGACLAKMFMGNRSIKQIFCTREIFNRIQAIRVLEAHVTAFSTSKIHAIKKIKKNAPLRTRD
jgi:NADH pyrophosphatase NudC (nudix superfamily)